MPLAVVFVLLAVPVLYVVLRHPAATSPVTQGTTQNGAPLSQLEALAKAQPTAENRINLSQAYIQNKSYGQAIDLLTPLVAEMPKNAIAWNNLCVARMLQQEINLALEACQHGVESDSSFQLVRNNLRWAQGERDKTLAAIAEQEKTEPANRDVAFYLSEGLNQLHLGLYDQAMASWQQVLKFDPKNALAWNNIGTAQMMQHHPQEARASFEHAKELDPGNALMSNNLAWAEHVLQAGR